MNLIEKSKKIDTQRLPLTKEEIEDLSRRETLRMVLSPVQMRIIADLINEECNKRLKDYKNYLTEYFTVGTNPVKKERLETESCDYFREIWKDLENFKKESCAYFERSAKDLERLKKEVASGKTGLCKKIEMLEKEINDRKFDLSQEIKKFENFDFENFKNLTLRQKIAIYKKFLARDFEEILLPLEEIKLSLNYNSTSKNRLLTLSYSQAAYLRENSEAKPLYDLLQTLLTTGKIQTLPSDLQL